MDILLQNGVQLDTDTLKIMIEYNDETYLKEFLDYGLDNILTTIHVSLCDTQIEKLLNKNGIQITKKPREAYNKDIIYIEYPNEVDTSLEKMSSRYWMNNLFYLDGAFWNSVDQYVYYNINKRNTNGEKIKQFKNRLEMDRFLLLQKNKNTNKYIELSPSYEKSPFSYLYGKRLLEKATQKKFEQNTYLVEILKNITRIIVTNDYNDLYGYLNNNLGNVLMNIRNHHTPIPPKYINTNNLRYFIYKPKPNFYIVKGNPDEIHTLELNKLSTYKTKKGMIVKGKYNPKLIDGGGWLIPIEKEKKLEALIFNTYPENIKIQKFGRRWMSEKVDKIINISRKLIKTDNKKHIPQNIVQFVLIDIYNTKLVTGEKVVVPIEFLILLNNILEKYNVYINKLTQELLWEFISNMIQINFEDIVFYDDMVNRVQQFDIVFHRQITSMDVLCPPLDNFIYLFTQCFRKCFNLIKQQISNEKMACMITIDILVGNQNYNFILKSYKTKIKYDKKGSYDDEVILFQERFDIHVHFLKEIIDCIPKVDKKCKLLLLTAIEFLENMNENDENKYQLYKEFYTIY